MNKIFPKTSKRLTIAIQLYLHKYNLLGIYIINYYCITEL